MFVLKKIFFKLLEPERYFLLSGTGSIPGIFVSLEKCSEKIEKNALVTLIQFWKIMIV